MDTNKKIEFIKTTTSKLDNGDVEAVYPSESYIPIIHTQDENSNGTTDDQLYIGEDRITDKFNLGNTDLSGVTLPVGGLEATTFDQLKTRSISDILIDILTPISVSSVSLDQNTMILMIGDTGVLTATVLPANASDKTVTWSSSNENVITVNDGVLTSVNIGSATIIASSGGKTATCTVTVNPVPVSRVILNRGSITLTSPSVKYTLEATVNPSNATDKTVTWSSSDESVVTVNNGVVSVIGLGTATITASSGGQTATCIVTVSPQIPTISSSPSASISYDGDTFIGTGSTLPSQEDISYTISDGTWSDGLQYAGGHSIDLIMDPDKWGEEAEEGTYTISGSVTFLEGTIPVDNFGVQHQDMQYQGDTLNTTPIIITVVNPIYINGYLTDDGDDGDDILTDRSYVVDYRDSVTLYITIPSETYQNKMYVYIKGEFTTFNVLQYDKFAPGEDKYIIPITMVASLEDSPKYVGYTKYVREDNTYTNTAPTQYKITFRK